MNPAEFCIRNRVVTLVMTAALLFGGLSAYQDLSRLEDPEFTIKDALVITPYPGASATEVEQELSDELEIAIQQLAQLDEIESRSERGLSTLTVTIKNNYDKLALPQVWDELRRKVADAQANLPPGAGPSIVVDDFGDVYGIFFVVYGDEYSYAELKQVVDLLRRELLLVDDVAKIDTFGERTEAVYVELSRDRMSQIGIPESVIVDKLRQKNVATEAGRVKVGREFIAISPTGGLDAVADFESILISGGVASQQVYLRDVATVRRGYVEPQNSLIRFDGENAIGIGISTISGGNVVRMGAALRARMTELQEQIPLGIEFGFVSLQSDAVEVAIGGFVINLVEAVVIVIVVLLLFMGVRSGLLIGFVLVLTISASFLFMGPWEVALERISLGALIIALGMLVDNAIVIVDGVLVRLQHGEDTADAAIAVVQQTSIPLLGATVIAILAFAVIGTSDDSTGEFCRSLFMVVLISLMLSWLTAVTVTPLLCVMLLRAPESAGTSDGRADPYGGAFYGAYRGLLSACIRMRALTMTAVLVAFAAALWGFGFVNQSFFPSSTRPQFMVDAWLPQGTHIDDTTKAVTEIESYLLDQAGVTHVTALVGRGGLRFLLTYGPEKSNSAYVQFLVDVDHTDAITTLIPKIERDLALSHEDVLSYAFRFELGPGANGKVRARLEGPDLDVLRGLEAQVVSIFEADADAKAIRSDWRQRVKVLRAVIAEEQANLAGIDRTDVALELLQGFQGLVTGVYREGDLLLPIVLRAPASERQEVASVQDLQIWSPTAGRRIPLRQVVAGFETHFEDEIIYRRDRKRTLTVFADPRTGPATQLLARVRPQIEGLDFPAGYSVAWGGEFEDSANAQGSLIASIPGFVAIMVLITVALFNSLRQPLIIWCCVPLALIGVTSGLLVTSQPFGFMALLGSLSLTGMLIKNAIVLIDQINLEIARGKSNLVAILDSGTSRLRPVAMAASTTVLGMAPLLADAFFVAMAVTIIAGLIVATVLTMIVVPTLYAIFYGTSE